MTKAIVVMLNVLRPEFVALNWSMGTSMSLHFQFMAVDGPRMATHTTQVLDLLARVAAKFWCSKRSMLSVVRLWTCDVTRGPSQSSQSSAATETAIACQSEE